MEMHESLFDILEEQEADILTDKDIKSITQSLLFIHGDPLSAEDIRDTIDKGLDLRRVKRCIKELADELDFSGYGLKIFNFNNRYQLGTDKKYSQYVEKLVSPYKKKSLTKSAIETLTIIAYKQPITRIEVEDIRGVKSSAVFDTLLNNELIAVAGVAKKIGRPKLYKTTDNFLKALDIKSLDELPDIEKHKSNQISM